MYLTSKKYPKLEYNAFLLYIWGMNEPLVQYEIEGLDFQAYRAPNTQLLKWIGNKQRFAEAIASHFPRRFGTFIEPFIGSGAVLATVAPTNGIGADVFSPLIDIWQTLKTDPDTVVDWYADRWHRIAGTGKRETYAGVLRDYNANPNGADFLFLTRSCYGGVVRFRKADGFMSTPCGVHDPINPTAFRKRVVEWHGRVRHTTFHCADYRETFARAKPGDMVYCDPPYSFSQAILYGAQAFNLNELLVTIETAKASGVYVALSIDGDKKSGDFICDLPIPPGLFARERSVNIGRSMLRRFQMEGQTLENELVSDRLLLTY
jgi:DNA adenine methylase